MHATLLRSLAILSRKAARDLAHALRHWSLATPGLVAVRVKVAPNRRRMTGQR
jgi:hypothetical protein